MRNTFTQPELDRAVEQAVRYMKTTPCRDRVTVPLNSPFRVSGYHDRIDYSMMPETRRIDFDVRPIYLDDGRIRAHGLYYRELLLHVVLNHA